jgi:hypothetical protein
VIGIIFLGFERLEETEVGAVDAVLLAALSIVSDIVFVYID